LKSSNTPRISVCVPTYNGERHLRECLDSVLAQTYRDFEVLIVDDDSADASLAIAEEYAERDARIRILRNARNVGLVGNWNRCVQETRGEWIKFVFQDDTIFPECLALLLEGAASGRILIACRRRFVFEGEIPEATRMFYEANRATIQELFADAPDVSPARCQELALTHFGGNIFGEPTAIMLHRSTFTRFGSFNPNLIVTCDLEFWTRVSIHAGVKYIPVDLATFRVHASGTSATARAQREYRMLVLDKLVILHEFAYHDVYEPLRRMAQGLRPPLDLRRALDERRHEARALAGWANRHPSKPDPSLMAEWNEVSRAYPKIAVSDGENVVWRLRRRFFPPAPRRFDSDSLLKDEISH